MNGTWLTNGSVSLESNSTTCLLEPEALTYTYIAIRFIEGFMAIAGNSLTIAAVFIDPELSEANINLVIACLAAGDLLSGFVPPFLLLTHIYQNRDVYIWRLFTFVNFLINTSSTAANVVFICLIAVDRFIFISSPLRYAGIVTRTRSLTAIGIISLVPLVYLPALVCSRFRFEGTFPCRDESKLFKYPYKYGIWVAFFSFTFVTIILYTAISCIARRQRRAVGTLEKMAGRFRRDEELKQTNSNAYQPREAGKQSGDNAQEQMTRSEYKITKMMTLVLGVYHAAYIPYFITNMAIVRSADNPLWVQVLDKASA